MRRAGVLFRFPPSVTSPGRNVLPLLGAIASALLISSSSRAEIPEFDWGAPALLDSAVQDVGDSGGRTAEFDFLGDGLWRLVYVKGNDIQMVVGNDSGWSSPTQISDDPAASRAPAITSTGSLLHVVWEDERSGHPEIWTRRYDGSSWSTAECLSCDPQPSRKPALDGFGEANYAYVAWETELEGGARAIEGRAFGDTPGEWGPTEPVSEAPGNATDPAIAVTRSGGWGTGTIVAWVDDRFGETEIYSRKRDYYHGPSWTDEERVTDLAGNCVRPRLAADICCYDTPELNGFLVFENDGGAAVESWAAFHDWMEWAPAFRLSTDDGLDSKSPRVAGVKFSPGSCYDGDTNLSFVSWTDHLPGGTEQQFARYDFGSGDEDAPLELGSIVASGLAAHTRSPDAPVLQTWLTGDGVLSARQGLELNCREDVAEFAPYFYVAPEGGNNEVSLTDICRDEPVPNGYMEIRFYNDMESRFAVDPFQEIETTQLTNEDGIANFVFRGGGCVTDERGDNGVIAIWCDAFHSDPLAWYVQIKSPDIDGTCSVDDWDLQYVEDRIGTDDFCADLDGSGLVDELDVAMVAAALGDECERTSDAPEESTNGPGDVLDPDLSGISGLRVVPNPGSDRFELHFSLRTGERATVRIVDVVGRTVRELGTPEASRDGVVPLEWDGRNGDGRPVAAGVYYANLHRESAGGSERATIIVTR